MIGIKDLENANNMGKVKFFFTTYSLLLFFTAIISYICFFVPILNLKLGIMLGILLIVLAISTLFSIYMVFKHLGKYITNLKKNQ
jgi:hypothetical protein